MGPPALAYPIDRTARLVPHHPVRRAVEAVAELERGLNITEELLRHLVTRVERPVKAARRDGAAGTTGREFDRRRRPRRRGEDDDGEFIDESESEAAPAAID